MELLSVIRRLLYEEDCMIIPGLGGFISQHHPSRIIAGSGTFMPPAKEIGFSRDLVHNDGVLQNTLAEMKSVSLEEAREMISDFVNEVHRKTGRGEKVVIEGVGYFYTDGAGPVQFQIDAGINFLLDSYGLSPFHIRQLEQVHDPANPSLWGSNRPGVENPQNTRKGREFLVPDRKASRIILIALPLVVLLSLVPRYPGSKRVLNPTPASLAPESVLSQPNSSTGQPGESAREAAYPVNAADSVSSLGIPATNPSPAKRYPLVAGSFKSEINALNYTRQLKSKGFQASVVLMPNRFHRVVLESFNSFEEARIELNRIRKTEPTLDLWIDK